MGPMYIKTPYICQKLEKYFYSFVSQLSLKEIWIDDTSSEAQSAYLLSNKMHPTTNVLNNDIKQSDSEAQVLEIWGIWSTHCSQVYSGPVS